MSQELIVYIIVIFTVLYIIWNNIRKLLPILFKKYKNIPVCSSCSNKSCFVNYNKNTNGIEFTLLSKNKNN